MNSKTFVVVLLMAVSVSGAFAAEKKHAGHDMPAMKAMGPGADTPAAEGYMMAMDTMNGAMAKMRFSGDADADFVRSMIPHHQAAIDMAKVQLQYGKNADMRRLAEDIIAAQQKEIAEMKIWLAKHPGQ